MVVRGERDDYPNEPSRAQDVVLVIEVSDTNLAKDQNEKARIYARAGIPEYWIVNLVSAQIEVYTGPTAQRETPDYGEFRMFGITNEIPLIIEGREIPRLAVEGILPRRA
jgi:hypothetical protein